MSKKTDGERLVLTPKTARDIAFTVHKKHYYDCREVDDVLDALLELIDRLEDEKQEIDGKLRDYEANIAGIMLRLEQMKNDAIPTEEAAQEVESDPSDTAEE